MNELLLSLMRSIQYCNQNSYTIYHHPDIEGKKQVKHEIYVFQENEEKNTILNFFLKMLVTRRFAIFTKYSNIILLTTIRTVIV